MSDTRIERTDIVRRRRSSATPWLLFILTLLAGGYAVHWLWEKLEASRAKTMRLSAELAEKQKVVTKVTKERVVLETRIDELEIRDRELSDENMKLSSDVQAKEKELAKLKATYVDMESKLTKEIESGEIRLTQIGEKLQVELIDKILFDSGDATISKRGEEVLMRVGQVLGTIKDKQIQVSGHTDSAPISEKLRAQFPTNWELSVARATNVVRFLGEKAGVPERLLVASGHGPYKPVSSNATAVGRSRNRRIEILLTPALRKVPAKKTSLARTP
jgi:chemotaxis protein MotB